MNSYNPESKLPKMIDHMDDVVDATNIFGMIGLVSYGIGSLFEAKGLAELGGIVAISGVALNGLSRIARAVVNYRHQTLE